MPDSTQFHPISIATLNFQQTIDMFPKIYNFFKLFSVPISRPLSRQTQSSSSTSIFDAIRKPPSVAMEKIKSQTSATLDRMTNLQNRYRQHQETMRSDSDRSRRTSTASNFDVMVNRNKPFNNICVKFLN